MLSRWYFDLMQIVVNLNENFSLRREIDGSKREREGERDCVWEKESDRVHNKQIAER